MARAGRVAAVLLAIAMTAALAGCGSGGGGDSTTGDEKAADAELLNEAIGQELTTVDAYDHGIPLLRAELSLVGRQLRGQAYEAVDALTKTMRGLGAKVEAEAAELDLTEVKTEADFLRTAYEMEMAALAFYTDAAVQLETSAPRRLAASLAASKAQHLVALRQSLGADLVDSFPEAFDSDQVPPPGAPADGETASGETPPDGETAPSQTPGE